MDIKQKIITGVITGFVIITGGVVGPDYFTQEDIDNITIESNQVVQEVKSENYGASVVNYTSGNLNYIKKYVKTYQYEDGSYGDSPRPGAVLVTDVSKMITQISIDETAQEKIDRLEQEKLNQAIEKANHEESIRVKNIKDKMYSLIQEKSVQLEIDPNADVTSINNDINNLKSLL